MELQNFKVKKGLSYTYIAIPITLIGLLIITLTASGGDFYVGPGGVSALLLVMGIWYLNNDVIVRDGDDFAVKLSVFAKKHVFSLNEIKELDNSNPRKMIIILNTNAKIKVAMNMFSEEDKEKVRQAFR